MDGFTAKERRGDRALGIGCDDDDRQRATRPGDVHETPHAWLTKRVGERALRGRGQDDGGDGHGTRC